MVSSREIRRSFLDFFGRNGHEIVDSGPLVPSNDPTLMFANAGMVPFKDVFTGKDKRPYTRATSSQKCIRISGKHNDLENVGVTARHHTLFEMLGNFSFGDYFKEDAIKFAWRFFIDELKLDPERMVITVFGGEEGFGGEDTEAAKLWKDVTGYDDERIIRCGAKDNFWQMGETGPCGPCAEIHYAQGVDTVDPRTFGEEPTPDGRGWFELWNLVFMQFDQQADGTLKPLPAPSVDTGAGLERVSVVKQGVLSNYDTDLFLPLVTLAGDIAGKKYARTQSEDDTSMRVIADHARMAAFAISEGIFPDKDKRPYVLRRVMRRAIRHGHRLGIGENFLHQVTDKVVDEMGDVYPQLVEQRALIAAIVQAEETRFRRTMDRGLQLLDENESWSEVGGERALPGDVAFKLYDTYGFPVDLQEVIGRESDFVVDHEGFDAEMNAAKERSRGSKVGEAAVGDVYPPIKADVGAMAFEGYDGERRDGEAVIALARGGERVESLAAGDEAEVFLRATPFYPEKGGQVGDIGALLGEGLRFDVTDTQTPMDGVITHRGVLREGALSVGDAVDAVVDGGARGDTRRNHSATHLLHWALREVLGPTVAQKGSLVGPARLRFDYSGTRPMTGEEIQRVEDLVNDAILENHAITTDEMAMDAAKASGAIGIFEEKYGDVVRVLSIGPSKELCGGTHAARTGDIGLFTIQSEGGLAAGVRRIEAATGRNAIAKQREVAARLASAAALLKARPDEIEVRVQKMLEEQKALAQKNKQLTQAMMQGGAKDLSADAREINGAKVLGAVVQLGDAKALREQADQLRDKLAPAVILLGSEANGKALLACSVSKELTKTFKAGDLVRRAAKIVGGGGGGRPDFAQAGGSDPSQLDAAVADAYAYVEGGG